MNTQKIFCLFIPLFIFIAVFCCPNGVFAAPTYDDAVGTYTDDFATTGGVVTSSGAGVNTSTGVVQLRNSSNGYTAPYNTTGYIKTSVVRPLRIAKWGTLNITSTIPEGTTIKVQIMDDGGTVFSDTVISGNSTGITSFPVDLSGVSPFGWENVWLGNKIPMIQFKFIFSTTNTSVTATITNLTLTWSLTQGDLTTSLFDSTSPRTSFTGTQKGPYATRSSNELVYPAFRWISVQNPKSYWSPETYVLEDRLFAIDSESMFTLDRDSGEILSKSPWGSSVVGNITQNGTLYGVTTSSDIIYAFDTNNSTVKWIYNYKEGHGNAHLAIGNDGTLFNIWAPSSGGRNITLYAFNQDSSIEYTKVLTLGQVGDTVNASAISVGDDGTLYLSYSTYNASTYVATPNSELLAISPTDGSIIWRYSIEYGGAFMPLIDANGTIFVGEYTTLAGHDVKLFAINSDGTLKWTKNVGTDTRGPADVTLDADGNFVAFFTSKSDWNSFYYVMDANDGSTLRYVDFDESNYLYLYDSNGGLFVRTLRDSDDPLISILSEKYYNSATDLKWEIPYSYANTCYSDNGNLSYSLKTPRLDERGWIYYGMNVECQDADYNVINEETYAQVFALAPWSLTSFTNVLFVGVSAGDTITFTATSSMQETNPVFEGDNQVQVIMDNGVKVPLTFSNLNSSGNSVWTGTYTLPSNISAGSHSYTVEASQAYLKTDITTHFATATTNSENTGIVSAGSFSVKGVSTSEITPIRRIITTVVVEEEVVEETGDKSANNLVLTFVDQNGQPMVNAVIIIDGEEYISNANGEITLENVDATQTYTARITYNGKTYTEEILGVSNGEEEIVIDTGEEQEDIAVVEDKKTNIWVFIVPIIVILLVGGGVLLNKKQSI